MKDVFVSLYKTLTILFGPAIRWHLKRRLRKGKEHPKRFAERLGTPSRPRPTGPLVWIHTASVGESLSALSVIKRLSHDAPNLSIMITTGTVTSAEVIQHHLPPHSFHQFLPVDLPQAVMRFLDHWQPTLTLWFESEIWPNLLTALRYRNLPAFLVNARLSDRSYAKWQRFPYPMRSLLRSFEKVYAQSPEQAERFRSLGAQNVFALGNLKFAAAPLPYTEEEYNTLARTIGDRPLWLAASTHEGEEEIILAAHEALREIFPALITIIAPRHPHRGPHIQDLCQQRKLSATLRTGDAPLLPTTSIYIANTLGELGLFYRLAPIIFVGGSIAPIGGHNIIEPAHFGKAILHGPHMENFREITHRFVEAKASLPIAHQQDLIEKVGLLLSDPHKVSQAGKEALKIATSDHEALDHLMQDVSIILQRVTS